MFFGLVGSLFTMSLVPGLMARALYIEKRADSDEVGDENIENKFTKIRTT